MDLTTQHSQKFIERVMQDLGVTRDQALVLIHATEWSDWDMLFIERGLDMPTIGRPMCYHRAELYFETVKHCRIMPSELAEGHKLILNTEGIASWQTSFKRSMTFEQWQEAHENRQRQQAYLDRLSHLENSAQSDLRLWDERFEATHGEPVYKASRNLNESKPN